MLIGKVGIISSNARFGSGVDYVDKVQSAHADWSIYETNIGRNLNSMLRKNY